MEGTANEGLALMLSWLGREGGVFFWGAWGPGWKKAWGG